MAAVTDFANAAAAVAAGYVKTQIDRGASFPAAQGLRFVTRFDKPSVGAVGDGGARFEATGESSVNAAGADTQAVAALNAQRRHYYGGSPGRASGDGQSPSGRGGAHTVDVS